MIIKSKMKSGNKVTGQVVQIFEGSVVLEGKDEKRIKIPVPKEVTEQIDSDYDGEIITLSINDDGDYSIEHHDDFPDEKEKK